TTGGGAGRINCVAYNPGNTDIIWVGAPAGGLWKSTNGGVTWSTTTDDLANIGVSWIVIDPNNTNIMYLATGDGDGYDTYSIGILKSTNGGVTWNTTGLSMGVSSYWAFRKVLMHPSNSAILIAVSNAGIYKSTNSGTNWSQIIVGNFRDIEVNESTPTVWYAARHGYGVYKSTDTGDSWGQLSTGLPISAPGRVEVEVAQSMPTTVYALYAASGGGYYGLYRSTDSGANWGLQSSTPNLLGWYDGTGGDATGGQGSYDLTLAVNPSDATEVYVGGVNIWRSTNSGVNWSVNSFWYYWYTNYAHADHHYLEFKHGSSTELISGNDGGVFRTTDDGATWSDFSNNLAIHQIYRLGVSALDSGTILIGNQDNGTDLLTSSTWDRTYSGDGMECAINPSTPTTMYCSYVNGAIKRSTNGGSNWSAINSGLDAGAWVTPFQLDPAVPTTIYAGTSYVNKSTDQGSNWTTISGNLSSNKIRSLAVAPSNSNYIYAAGLYSVYTTRDGGSTSWTTVSGGGVPTNSITYLAVHPTNPNVVYLTRGSYYSGSKVFRSTDGGSNWTNISTGLPNIPVNCVVIDHTSNMPNKPVYVGTDLGVYYSETGLGGWEVFDHGLPNVIVKEMEIHTTTRKIRAATYGRGLWEMDAAPGAGYYNFHGSNYNGTVGSEVAIYRPSNGRWCVKGQASVAWGISSDIPVPGDYDGDGDTDIAIFRPSNGRWCVKGQASIAYGTGSDIPVPADYDGDGDTDIAIYRPSTGRWCIRGQASIAWGTATDIPVPADYDGDGSVDIAIYRPSTGRWCIRGQASQAWGTATDVPVPADYDGDGSADIAIFRPSNGRWCIKGQATQIWGTAGDVPLISHRKR
ncbi:MAG: hypothetical protein GY765_38445, partial [bacterium]|nr:hypothetical protein [bacterium]